MKKKKITEPSKVKSLGRYLVEGKGGGVVGDAFIRA